MLLFSYDLTDVLEGTSYQYIQASHEYTTSVYDENKMKSLILCGENVKLKNPNSYNV